MTLPVDLPIAPMLAKAVATVPAPSKVEGGYSYEPKWDGFRCIVSRDGDAVELGSRGEKPLTRYFPEVVEAVLRLLPEQVVVDCELVVRRGEPGAQRLDWEALAQRIHPAESRITRLAAETPAEMVCFDLLALGDESLLDRPFHERRTRLEAVLGGLSGDDPIHLTRTTADPAEAERWFEEFEGAGLDGVMAKPMNDPYAPGKRTMLKIKHKRSTDAVVYGYRVHKSGVGVGSLLLGLYDEDGQLRPVGGIVSLPDAMRKALVEELEPLVRRDDSGAQERAESQRSRFSVGKDAGFVPLEPSLVVEIGFDQLEGSRLRHAASFVRWRPDREPESCLLSQIERAPAYDLGDVLVRG